MKGLNLFSAAKSSFTVIAELSSTLASSPQARTEEGRATTVKENNFDESWKPADVSQAITYF